MSGCFLGTDHWKSDLGAGGWDFFSSWEFFFHVRRLCRIFENSTVTRHYVTAWNRLQANIFYRSHSRLASMSKLYSRFVLAYHDPSSRAR